MKPKVIIAVLASCAAILAVAPIAHAATTADSKLTQTITAGTLSTSIRTAAGAEVVSPSFAMTAATVSAAAQTTTGVYGDNAQRITVDNGTGSGNGWTLSLAGTAGAATVWTDGGGTPKTYPFNGTTTTGQLTVNAAVSTITPTAPSDATGVTKGTSSAFSAATPITIMTAGGTAQKVWNGYMTGVALSQIVPAYQAPASYTIDLTQTVVAN